jgi:hypothetical protein
MMKLAFYSTSFLNLNATFIESKFLCLLDCIVRIQNICSNNCLSPLYIGPRLLSSCEGLAWNGTIIREQLFEKKIGKKRSWPNLRHYPRHLPGGNEKNC